MYVFNFFFSVNLFDRSDTVFKYYNTKKFNLILHLLQQENYVILNSTYLAY